MRKGSSSTLGNGLVPSLYERQASNGFWQMADKLKMPEVYVNQEVMQSL